MSIDERQMPEPLVSVLAGPGWVRSEQVIMCDGQLGEDLSRPSERVNPEGTSDIARPIDADDG